MRFSANFSPPLPTSFFATVSSSLPATICSCSRSPWEFFGLVPARRMNGALADHFDHPVTCEQGERHQSIPPTNKLPCSPRSRDFKAALFHPLERERAMVLAPVAFLLGRACTICL
ncbi:hypothetical protein BDW66DRAFT_133012 [Aspergillus desertorum]